VQLVNIFNLFFLLIVNPLPAILLILRRLSMLDTTRVSINTLRLPGFLEIAGLTLYVMGYLLMAWALIRLGRNYQPGGSAPLSRDTMVMRGHYKLVRHPMYASALSISLGLALLSRSWAILLVFCIYLVLILPLIAGEEDELRKAYGEQYVAYEQRTRKLIPFVF
jgi:protein-S-isoprenylcysteine O-methyltransferase Ste14